MYERHNAARAHVCAGHAAVVRGVFSDAARVDLRRPKTANAIGQLASNNPSRLAARLAHVSTESRKLPGIPWPNVSRETIRPRHCHRTSSRNEAQSRGQDLPGGTRVLSRN